MGGAVCIFVINKVFATKLLRFPELASKSTEIVTVRVERSRDTYRAYQSSLYLDYARYERNSMSVL